MALFGKREPEAIVIKGRPLSCVVCGHDRFGRREAQLNTAMATFFNMDWANRTATCFVCDECGYIHWFLRR
ncbi:MAG: hypothetical protein WD069_17155 [Planctomycetales bacterium]